MVLIKHFDIKQHFAIFIHGVGGPSHAPIVGYHPISRASNPPYPKNVNFEIGSALINRGFLDDIKGTKAFDIGALVGHWLPGFSTIPCPVERDGIRNLGEIIRTHCSDKTHQAVHKGYASKKGAFLFQLQRPRLPSILGMIDPAVPVHIPTQFGINKGYIVLLSGVTFGVQFGPSLGVFG